MRRSPSRAFTLIEILVVLVIVGLLAAIAIPKYLDIATNAKISVCQGVLAGIRSSLMLQYTESRLHGSGSWPSLADVQDNVDNMGSKIMLDGNLPDNPFSTGLDKDLVVATQGKPKPVGTTGAWAYDPATGHFWANTDSGNAETDF